MPRAQRAARATLAVGVLVATAIAMYPAAAAAANSPFEQASFSAQGLNIVDTTASTRMTIDDKDPSRGYGGPTSMLVDPSNPRVIVAATAQLRSRVCKLLRSDDAGQTWHVLKNSPSPSAYPYCMTPGDAGSAQAMIAWGSHGVLYYAMSGYNYAEGQTGGDFSTILARSTDLGTRLLRGLRVRRDASEHLPVALRGERQEHGGDICRDRPRLGDGRAA